MPWSIPWNIPWRIPEDFIAVLIDHPHQKINTPLKFHILLHKLLPSVFWSELILHSLPDCLRNWPLTTFMMLGIFLVKALIRYIKSKKIRKGHSFSRNSGSKCPFGFSHIFCKQHTVSTVLSLSQQSSCVSLSPKYTGKRNFMCFRNLPSGCSCS